MLMSCPRPRSGIRRTSGLCCFSVSERLNGGLKASPHRDAPRLNVCDGRARLVMKAGWRSAEVWEDCRDADGSPANPGRSLAEICDRRQPGIIVDRGGYNGSASGLEPL